MLEDLKNKAVLVKQENRQKRHGPQAQECPAPAVLVPRMLISMAFASNFPFRLQGRVTDSFCGFNRQMALGKSEQREQFTSPKQREEKSKSNFREQCVSLR